MRELSGKMSAEPTDGRSGEPAGQDPLTLAVIHGALESIVREMTITIVKTSRSPVLAEGYDFSNCLFDGSARMIVQGDNIPVHVGAMIAATKNVTEYFADEVFPGDVIYCNDPAFLGSHLPDMVMYKPVFYEGELVFWTANKSHMMDTGGGVAGGYNPFASDLYSEGFRISPVKLYDRGEVRRDVIDLLLTNVRIPRFLRGDLRAQLAAVSTAEQRLLALLERHGKETVARCSEALLDRGERIMREEIRAIPDGTHHGSAVLEDYGHGRGDAEITVTLEVTDDELEIRFDAPPQTDTYFNAYWPNTQSMAYFALLAVTDPTVPHNEGLYRPVRIDFGPEGSIVNAQIPAACAQSTGSVAEVVWDAVAAAFSAARPPRACAGWCRPYVVIFAGTDPRTGESWADYSLAGGMGGGGAVAGMDGWDAVGWANSAGACHHGDTELMEYKEPVRILRHELREDSACAGRWRGGLGTVHEVELLAPVTVTTIADGVKYPPPSRNGASSKFEELKVHAKWIAQAAESQPVEPQTVVTAPAGTRILSHSAGGGGVGDSFRRELDAVVEDVRSGVVSLEGAQQEYGVVVDPETFDIDEAATAAIREKLQETCEEIVGEKG